ncbi:MAG: SprT family zinc-dependent metalloprotease [Bacteroidales bacterium]|nr:M48 family metallopeptidase [Bacteroidales bacterium]
MEILEIEGVVIEIEFKRIKNIYLRVYTPDARVRISAPKGLPIDAIRGFAISRIEWIANRRRFVLERERLSARVFESGEMHYFKGKNCCLNLCYENKPPRVMFGDDGVINLFVRDNASVIKKEAVMKQWYKNELRMVLPPLIEKWERILGVKIESWDIKLMKTIWGSCNCRSKKVLFNLELIKKPAYCIEYIVLHELAHLIERSHNARFKSILDKHMPQWREIKNELNSFKG